MKTITVKLEFIEPVLGTCSSNPDIHREFIASKAPNALSTEEEVAALGIEAVEEKSMTVFPKQDGIPFFWDYQLKGFFKDSCSMLARVPGTASNKLKAYKKVIDGTVFVTPRRIKMTLPDGSKLSGCQRPLRGQTAQGERIALAHSEEAPQGTSIEFQVVLLDESHEKLLIEWLDYGVLRGIGQWRNSGKGRFKYELC